MSIDSILELSRNLGGILVAVFLLSIVLWTYKDARRRIDDPILIATAVGVSMFPIFGVMVYLLLRPPEYLADVRERELEMRAIERSLAQQERCPSCRSFIEHDFLSCPICLTKLREPCIVCDHPVDPQWQLCPYCETEVSHRSARVGRPSGNRGRRTAQKTEAPTADRSAAKKKAAARSQQRAKRSTGSKSKESSKNDDKSSGYLNIGAGTEAMDLSSEPVRNEIRMEPLAPRDK